MHLTPREQERLLVYLAAMVSRDRLERGLTLNVVEAQAVIVAQVLEWARDGETVAGIMVKGSQILRADQVMEGVPEMLSEVQIEATFPDGTKLVTIHDPIPSSDNGVAPGAVLVKEEAGPIVANQGRETTTVNVANRGDRPVQVGSHFHFFEANRMLQFDREKAYGMRLNIPAGTAVRFEPGDEKTVELVAVGGHRVVYGGNGLVQGALDDASVEAAARQRVVDFAKGA
jgi:urease subunit gamma/beta